MRIMALNPLRLGEIEPTIFGPSLSSDCTQEINLTSFKIVFEHLIAMASTCYEALEPYMQTLCQFTSNVENGMKWLLLS